MEGRGGGGWALGVGVEKAQLAAGLDLPAGGGGRPLPEFVGKDRERRGGGGFWPPCAADEGGGGGQGTSPPLCIFQSSYRTPGGVSRRPGCGEWVQRTPREIRSMLLTAASVGRGPRWCLGQMDYVQNTVYLK